MPEYMILRNAAAGQGSFESFDPSAPSSTVAEPPEPQIETHDISSAEAVSASRDPGVAAIALPMPIVLIEPFESSSEIAAGDSWGISAVQADTSSLTGNGVVVAVLDTGIDNTHPAFAGLTILEKDFSGSGNGDGQGHGTHCAGTIFGRDIDDKRIGIARGVSKALIGKVLGNSGRGSSEAIFRGIQWALDEGADIVSMSLGLDFPGAVKRMESSGMPTEPAVSSALEAYRSNLRFFDALMQMVKARAAFRDTAVIVAATGNQARRPSFTIAASLPAASEGVLSVAALSRGVDGKFEIAPFSNTMAQVAAPGVDILSAKAGGGLRSLSGTSMACPHVVGVAALWWEFLRSARAVKPTADLVAAHLVTHARTNVLAANATPVDRGSGIVTAPQ